MNARTGAADGIQVDQLRAELAPLNSPAAVPGQSQGSDPHACTGGRAAPAVPVAPVESYEPRESFAPLASSQPRDPGEHLGRGGPGDFAQAADSSAVQNLLRCWVRENNIPRPEQDILRLNLHAIGIVLRVQVLHWSATGRHRFAMPLPESASPDTGPLDAVTLAALIAREAAHRGRDIEATSVRATGVDGRARLAESTGLVARVADSVQRTAEFLAGRSAAPETPPGTGPFLDAEQSLVLGHPLHPAPKSRQGLSEDEGFAYAPELRAAFPLHWMAVDRSVLACDSAWTERGRTVTGEQLAMRLAGDALSVQLPPGTVPLPLHPWQARQLQHRPQLARMLDEGLLHDLGQAGDVWHATSSVRTVAQPGGPAMLKLSLSLPITNSRRENLRKELLRGLEVHRLLRAGLGAQWRAAHPGFDIVRDPAWLGVDGPDGQPVQGMDTVIRHNPFGPTDDAVCLAGLTSPRPWPGMRRGVLRSRLTDIVERLAARTNRPAAAVAAEWFLRYLDAVVRPVLWLDAHAGIALEAHQQNTLVLLDPAGWPTGGRYRDNQGYYFRTSRREELAARLPAARLGVDSDSFVPDAVTDERFAYYLGINNIFGLIGAFGEEQLADERLLLAGLRRFLQAQSTRDAQGAPVSPLPALLLESPTLRCKANLLTRLHGMDEL
ncbi:MAG TPA: IucA/IucC family protein, partial [Streptomyces sp.]|nr:IucA/IucC family protein [Streptomyces sp.]